LKKLKLKELNAVTPSAVALFKRTHPDTDVDYDKRMEKERAGIVQVETLVTNDKYGTLEQHKDSTTK